MSVIRAIKTHILENHIHKAAPGVKRERACKKFSNVGSIGIILDGRDEECLQFVKKYADELRRSGKSVELLAYVPKPAKETGYFINFFTNEDANWFLKPTDGGTRSFMNQPFDLLVNMSPDKIMPLEYICALSSARCIIGNGTDHLNGYYDCIIKVNDDRSFSSFMENVGHYLNLQA